MSDRAILEKLQADLLSTGAEEVSTELDTKYGPFTVRAHIFQDLESPIVSLSKFFKNSEYTPVVRIHSACLFGETFSSEHCDCRAQMTAAQEEIQKTGGAVIYLPQEGRGAGLCNKIAAMEIERLAGVDTAQAFRKLGMKPDLRSYRHALEVLDSLGTPKEIDLITNNPDKLQACIEAGYKIRKRIEPDLDISAELHEKMRAKQKALGHHVYPRLKNGS